MSDFENSTMFLRVDLYGHGYTAGISEDVRKSLAEAPNKIVHGEWVSAHAPYLVAEFLVSVTQQIPVDAVVAFVFYGVKKTYDALKKRITLPDGKGPVISLVQVALPKYDVDLYCDPRIKEVDVTSLLNKMDGLVSLEAAAGRHIKRISFPVSSNGENNYYCGRIVSGPCFALWAIEYEEGALFEPQVYDEVNERFLENVFLHVDSTSKA